MRSLTDEFLLEVREHATACEQALLKFEQDELSVAEQQEWVAICFRAMHSIKGAAALAGFPTILKLAHSLETLLELLRQLSCPPAPAHRQLLLSSVDQLLTLFDDLEHSNHVDITPFQQQLADYLPTDPQVESQDQFPKLASPTTNWRFGEPINLDDLPDWFNESVQRLLSPDLAQTESTESLANTLASLYFLELDLRHWQTSRPDGLTGLFRALAPLVDPIVSSVQPVPNLDQPLLERPLVYQAVVQSKQPAWQVALRLGWHRQQWRPVLVQVQPDTPPQAETQSNVSQSTSSTNNLDSAEASNRGPDHTFLPTPRQSEQTKQLPIETSSILPALNQINLMSSATNDIVSAATAAHSDSLPTDSLTQTPADSANRSESTGSVRIAVELLDQLMTLTGELVLARNQLLAFADAPVDGLRQLVQHISHLTGELQHSVMQTRLQPLENLVAKFPRMIRDLGRELHKNIQLTITGGEVELDKSVLELLADPLTHILRNCCDHGIEMPAERQAAGKSSTGHIHLHAIHESGQIHLSLRDDGRGIDPNVIRRKALELGLRTPKEIYALADAEVIRLILLPGFSTARHLTSLSGRGVGMDVVRTNIEQLGGSLEIESTVGVGTTFHLVVPLTLAIIPCLSVTVREQKFVLPQRDLVELLCLRADQVARQIRWAYDQEVLYHRKRLLPLVRLAEVLAQAEPFSSQERRQSALKHHLQVDATPAAGETASSHAPFLYIAVVKIRQQQFALVVDRILDSIETVVKPLPALVRHLPCFSGATILGDGTVALILDLEGIARHTGISFDMTEAQPTSATASEPVGELLELLLFEYGPHEQLAVPLPWVRRLEHSQSGRLERVGDEEFFTAGDETLRLLALDKLVGLSAPPAEQLDFLLIPRLPGRSVAVPFRRILDVERTSVRLQLVDPPRPGILGAAQLRGRLTLVLDLQALAEPPRKSLRSSMLTPGSPPPHRDPRATTTPERRAPLATALPATVPSRKRILLAEDTQFFRTIVGEYLRQEGYEVTIVENGRQALIQWEKESFDLIVSDIEMPELNGWQLAETIRSREMQAQATSESQYSTSRMPMLALTTLSNEEDRQRVFAVGFDRYELKLDRDSFLTAVRELLLQTVP